MAWSTDYGVKSGDANYTYRQETITLANSSNGKTQTATVNFVPPNKDFIVYYAVPSVDAAVHTNILGSYAGDGTFVEVKADLITGMDNASYAAFYDVSANGDYPVYQIEVEEAATAAGADKDVTVTVAWLDD